MSKTSNKGKIDLSFIEDLDECMRTVRHLYFLLEQVNSCLLDMDFGPPENRNIDLDRVAALVAIAVDIAEPIGRWN